nr:protein NRT1/ PTR FAMILY 5.8-like [Ipomoea batatas]
MWSLPLISLGLGGFNASLQAFGADQLGEHEDEELPRTNDDVAGGGQSSDSKSSFFFQWWYFGVCCGCLLGVSVMSYIQDTIGWGLGFAVPTAVMLAAIALFLCGSRFYAVKNAREISIAAAIKTTVASTFKNCGRPQEKPNNVELQLQDHQNPLCDQDSDGAEKGINVSKMARVVLGLLPVWAMLLMFAVIFQQPATFFTRQGMTMKRNIGSKFMVPPAALQSAITISIIMLMPLYDKVFIPFIRAFTRNECGNRNVPVRGSHGDRSAHGEQEAPDRRPTASGTRNRRHEHILAASSIHFVGRFRHIHSRRNARILLCSSSSGHENLRHSS